VGLHNGIHLVVYYHSLSTFVGHWLTTSAIEPREWALYGHVCRCQMQAFYGGVHRAAASGDGAESTQVATSV